MAAALDASAKPFRACVQAAERGPRKFRLAGRHLTLSVTVAPSGRVTAPRLEEVKLDQSPRALASSRRPAAWSSCRTPEGPSRCGSRWSSASAGEHALVEHIERADAAFARLDRAIEYVENP